MNAVKDLSKNRAETRADELPEPGYALYAFDRGIFPPHKCLVIFFEAWFSKEVLPGQYDLLYRALHDILPAVEWPQEPFTFWGGRFDYTVAIPNYKTFKFHYLDRFGPLFDAVEFIKEYERNGGEVEVDRRGEVQALRDGRGNPTGANQHTPPEDRISRDCAKSSPGYSDTKERVEARLARDAQTDPQAADVMQRYGRGELTAHAAAVEMGWRKQQTRTTKFRSLWRNATDEERAQIEQDINDWHKGRWK
jgi:hypothetical protein